MQRKDSAFPISLLKISQKYCVPGDGGGGDLRQNAKEKKCISYIFAKEVTEVLCPPGGWIGVNGGRRGDPRL